jgi:hypothetical protein
MRREEFDAHIRKKVRIPLKPCPFCKSRRVVIDNFSSPPYCYFAYCQACDARGPVRPKYAMAKQLWNVAERGEYLITEKKVG